MDLSLGAVGLGVGTQQTVLAQILGGANFFADLTHSLVPNLGTGSATFTRATTATVKDHEGVLRTAIAGEARFEGARRVMNLIPSSESFATGWAAPGAASVSANAMLSPIGTLTADALIEDGTTAYHRINHASVTRTSGQVIAVSVHAKYAGRNLFMNWNAFCNAAGAFNLQTGEVTQGAGVASIEALDGGWYRCTVIGTCTATGADNGYLQLTPTNVSGSYAGDGVSGAYFWGVQLEDITGRADQTTPSEYVSVGALDYRSMNNQLYLSLPGTAGHYASTPDSVAVSTIVDIDLRGKLNMADWTPAAISVIAGTDPLTGAPNRTWSFYVDTAGKLNLQASLDGSTPNLAISSVAIGATDGTDKWVRVTRTDSTGVQKFYTSNDGATWTQLGTDVTTTAGSIFDSASKPCYLGNIAAGTGGFNGRIYSFQLYSAGVLAVDFNPHRDATTPTGTITSSTTGEVWTINGASSVVRNATYHGSGVDGVKCFSTDLSGNPIPSTTLLGYLAEGARTNLCTKSQEFDAWNTGVAGAGSVPVVTTNQAVAPDGTTTADKVVFAAPGAGDISQIYSHAFTATASLTYTSAIYVKAFAAGDIGKQLLHRHAGGSTYTALTLTSDWQRIGTSEASGAGGSRYCELVLRPSEGGSSGTVSCYLWGAQVELGSFASTYIPTTTVAVTRNADVLTYPSSGNVDGTKGWAYCEAAMPSGGAGNSKYLLSAGDNFLRVVNNSIYAYDGIANRIFAGVSENGTPQNLALTWGGSSTDAAINGIRPGAQGFDGNFNFGATLGIGVYTPTSGEQPFGTIRNVRIGQVALSAGTLGNITS